MAVLGECENSPESANLSKSLDDILREFVFLKTRVLEPHLQVPIPVISFYSSVFTRSSPERVSLSPTGPGHAP